MSQFLVLQFHARLRAELRSLDANYPLKLFLTLHCIYYLRVDLHPSIQIYNCGCRHLDEDNCLCSSCKSYPLFYICIPNVSNIDFRPFRFEPGTLLHSPKNIQKVRIGGSLAMLSLSLSTGFQYAC